MRIEPIYGIIGQRIRALREAKDMTQQELADSAGILRTSIANIEGAHQRVPLHTVYDISRALDIPPASPTP